MEEFKDLIKNFKTKQKEYKQLKKSVRKNLRNLIENVFEEKPMKIKFLDNSIIIIFKSLKHIYNSQIQLINNKENIELGSIIMNDKGNIKLQIIIKNKG